MLIIKIILFLALVITFCLWLYALKELHNYINYLISTLPEDIKEMDRQGFFK